MLPLPRKFTAAIVTVYSSELKDDKSTSIKHIGSEHSAVINIGCEGRTLIT